jgi:succinyl-CoA synthetase alpha subunit
VYANRQAVSALKPQVVSVFVPFTAAADAIINCIEEEVPLVVAYAEGIPQHDQLRVSGVDTNSRSVKAEIQGTGCTSQSVKNEIDGCKLPRYDHPA